MTLLFQSAASVLIFFFHFAQSKSTVGTEFTAEAQRKWWLNVISENKVFPQGVANRAEPGKDFRSLH
jgi:hypothetical protein